jgi:hypothetical protein
MGCPAATLAGSMLSLFLISSKSLRCWLERAAERGSWAAEKGVGKENVRESVYVC